MTVLFANNATATLASGITSGAVALALTTGQGALFPSPSGASYFYATLVDALNNIEIVRCTGRTGDTLTVVRGQQGTSARAYLAGDRCELRVTAGALQEMQALSAGAITATELADGAVTAAKILDGAVTGNKVAAAVITAAKLAAGAAVGNLGFTPVKQGGTDTVEIDWADPYVSLSVNTVFQGIMLFRRTDGAPASAGFRGRPGRAVASTAEIQQDDAGQQLTATVAGITLTLQNTSAIPYGDGFVLHIANISGGAISIGVAGGVTLLIPPSATPGARVIADGGYATLTKITGNTWMITTALGVT